MHNKSILTHVVETALPADFGTAYERSNERSTIKGLGPNASIVDKKLAAPRETVAPISNTRCDRKSDGEVSHALFSPASNRAKPGVGKLGSSLPSTILQARNPTSAERATGTRLTYEGVSRISEGMPNFDRNNGLLSEFCVFGNRRLSDEARSDILDTTHVRNYLGRFGETQDRTIALDLFREIAASARIMSFQEAMKAGLASEQAKGGTIKTAATAIGMGSCSLWKFANGKNSPSERQRPALERAETYWGYEPGTLTEGIAAWRVGSHVIERPFFDLENPMYDWGPERSVSKPLPAHAIDQLKEMFLFKTSAAHPVVQLSDGTIKRLRREGCWSRSQRANFVDASFGELTFYSAACQWIRLGAKFLGFEDAPIDKCTDTLAVLLDIERIERIIRHAMRHTAGYNNGHETVIGLIAHFLHPEHGFLVQRADLFLADAQKLGMPVDAQTWCGFVAHRHSLLKDLPKNLGS